MDQLLDLEEERDEFNKQIKQLRKELKNERKI